ncbi:MAG: alpha-amylase, partial [Bacteroides sp.]|nr:alpha-amylase [Bacteroides sp.]
MKKSEKIIIYQVFTRLFGNENMTRKRGGSIQENGCGKLADFTPRALKEIRNMGATHIWYTGVIEHATQTDYSSFGIAPDHPAVVKGKAGSPYAIKDYYDIDPDLATQVPERMKEFEALVKRTHQAKLKMITDFVPNHVARQYGSDFAPEGVIDLGKDDDTGCAFSRDNNFYYIPDTPFQGELDLYKGWSMPYREFPAKATGNNRFDAFPHINDWYETVKLNYGVDYPGGGSCHFNPVPDTWNKMKDILLFWAGKGVDGFRCDMVEMVPVEFWEWVIPQIRSAFPKIIFIAEVYNPYEYHHYIFRGKFDYLYDKVGLYDTVRAVMCGHESAAAITRCWQQLGGIEKKMLNFLENHDEQRIASDFFAGDARKGIPGMIVTACMNTNPVIIYFGQELGERGMDEEGFSGRDGRTTIFDYWGLESIRNWRNQDMFDGRLLSEEQKQLQTFYTRLLTLCNKEKAITDGLFFDLMYTNIGTGNINEHKQYIFLRKCEKEALLILDNFDDQPVQVSVNIPEHAFDYLQMPAREDCKVTDLLTGEEEVITLLSIGPATTTLKAL